MQEINVTMLGPSAVGKTSVLATMYERFKENVFEGGLRLNAEEKTSALLNKRLKELSTLPFKLTSTNLGGLQGTTDPHNYIFEVGKRDGEYALKITFNDYPGGYIYDHPDYVMTKVKDSDAILVAIDTPALMEVGGRWPRLHKDHNNPHGVADLFAGAYKSLDKPRLVMFVPVRSERYLKNPHEASLLLKKVKEGYGSTLEILQGKSLSSKVAIVITPVQTVGSVVFSNIEVDKDSDSGYRFVFSTIGPDAVFEPVDTEQPLRYLLRFIMRQHLEEQRKGGFFDSLMDSLFSNESEQDRGQKKREFWDGWLGELADIFMDRSDFRYALATFARGTKESPPFEIVQGGSLL